MHSSGHNKISQIWAAATLHACKLNCEESVAESTQKIYIQSRKIYQLCNDTKCSRVGWLRVIEMTIVTTEAGAFGPIFGPGHL